MNPSLKSGGSKSAEGCWKEQPRPTKEMCSVSSELSSSPDATLARWYETFATNEASSQSTRRSGASGLATTQHQSKKSRRSGGDPTVGREIRCCLLPSEEVRAATVSLGTQKTPVMLEAVVLAAKAVAGDPRNGHHLDPDIDGLFFFGGRVVQTHLQAERRKPLTNARLPTGSEHLSLPRTRKGEADLKQRSKGGGAADLLSPSARAVFSKRDDTGRTVVGSNVQMRAAAQEFIGAAKYLFCEL